MYRPTYSDAELFKKILIGGENLEEAFRDLMNREKSTRKIQKLIYSRGGSSQDYEEIFNDTLLALQSGIVTGRFNNESKIDHYMTRTAKNMLFLRFRKNKTRFVEIDHRIENQEPTIENNIIQKERNNMLANLIRKLSEKCQKILILAFIENHKNKELQVILNYKNDGVVRKVKSDCLRHLRGLLSENPNIRKNLNL